MYSHISNRLNRFESKQLIDICCKYHSVKSRFDFNSIQNINCHKINNNNKSLESYHLTQFRHIFGFPFRPSKSSSKVKKYCERRVLGYSKEQLFDVVSRVEDYHLFIPACVKSKVNERSDNQIKADLEIGIPPLIWEKYTSRVTLERPNLVIAKCIDGKIFNHLDTEWKFSDGLPNNKNTCTLDFKLSFEFKSALHSHLVHVFFDEMARQTVNAFLKRAEKLYGKQNFSNRINTNHLPNKT